MIRIEVLRDGCRREIREFLVLYGNEDCIHVLHILNRLERNAIQTLCLIRITLRIDNHRLNAVLAEFLHNVKYLGVAGVRAVFLERESEDRNLCSLDGKIIRNEFLDEGLRHILAHIVVDAAAGKNDLAVIAELLRAVCQVIRIDADAVASDETRLEMKEIPLRARCLENRLRIDSHPVENDGKLVHERNVDITLAVLDDLCGFRNLDGFGAVNARIDDELVHLCDRIERLFIHAGDNLLDGIEAVNLVARIDSLGAVADLPVNAALESGLLLDNRDTGLFRDTRINGRLENNNRARLNILSDKVTRALDRRQVRRVIVIDRCRNRDNNEARILKPCGIRRKLNRRLLHGLIADLIRGVDARLVLLDFGIIEIKSDNLDLLRKSDSNRHSDVSKANQGELILSA